MKVTIPYAFTLQDMHTFFKSSMLKENILKGQKNAIVIKLHSNDHGVFAFLRRLIKVPSIWRVS